MGKGTNKQEEEEEGIIDLAISQTVFAFRVFFGKCFASKPPEPAAEVVDLLADMRITPRLVVTMWTTFKRLKQYDSITARTGPTEVTAGSILRLVKSHREWVAKILMLLLDLAGFRDIVTWDGFLFVIIQFCQLSKLEVCQVMFYIVSKEMKSWTVHYLTSSQLEEFYDDYYACPVLSFNTNSIDFAKLPLAKYRMQDFIELCYRFSQLVNPCMHLQRSLRMALPSMRFWSDYDKIRTYNRKISLDFFRYRKVQTLLELIRQEAGKSVGPLQKYRQNAMDQYLALSKLNCDYKDVAKFQAAVLKAGELCRPKANGVIPLPFGVQPPTKERLLREMQLPDWMHTHLQANEVPGALGGKALGHAADLESKKRDLVPRWLTEGVEYFPKSVEEAEELVRATFGQYATKSRIKQIAADLYRIARPRGEDAKLNAIIRSQELEFIRKSRTEIDPPSLVVVMHKTFQEELIARKSEDPDNDGR
eukprot:TRINITY_DN32242_c0_g1_i1.p1 TRINITY_DN32242_c0_g1~~TRINITY_DN32242_c0_g1_i1.p1  ORF type:complete len:477 (-),score=82.95 TRINITY_DN32242_c0_g1_i1:42-1472(-)